jgi:hypothetical protein
MQKFWTWLKPKLVWILAGAGIVLGGVTALLTFGRSRPRFGKPPPRPELEDPKDVVVPDVKTDFNDKPADDYKKDKAKPNKKPEDDIDDLNDRFS